MQAVPVLVHGIQLGAGLRLVGIEAEVVAGIGTVVAQSFSAGITMPLGYCDGTRCYLPTSPMIEREGGYEVESYWEYGLPAPLAPGVEPILQKALLSLF